MMMARYRLLWFVAALLTVVATGCSLKKNTAASRQYSAFITRYNIYYNGDTHYKETLAEMERTYEDDYSRTLFVHPAEARADKNAPQPTGDFTRSIEKAQKAIQLRSIKKKPARKPGRASDPEYKAWLKRDEYNPFIHNAWMMMGRSQFNNGDFLGAASTFFYVSKHFTWLPATVTEAKLWQARAYCALDWLFEAETILRRIKPEEVNEDKTLRYLYNLAYADLSIKSNDYAASIPYLRAAVAAAPSSSQKSRLNFLLGQMLQRQGDNAGAYQAYGRASTSSAPYRTQFNARIRQSEVYSGSDINPEVKALRRMTRYDRNKDYLDQIYYAIGNLYLSRRDTTQAIANYLLAAEKSTRNGIDKALAQLTLGALYYDRGQYVLAQPQYAEAIPQIPVSYPDYKQLKRRSDYLDELAVYASNVELQDSLLRLSYMTPEEQTAVAERLIAELKKKEAEEAEAARREEMRAQLDGQANPFGDQTNAPNRFTLNADNSWYFYNPSTVTAGKTEFQRRWGSRRLEDDWRRRNKASFAFDTPSADEDGEDDAESADSDANAEGGDAPDPEAAQREQDPHYVEYYLMQIPHDDRERAVANDVIQEGLYNMGVILKDKLEDFPAATTEFDRLLTRYPDNIYRLDAYYNLYLMAVRSGDDSLAEHYRRLIVGEFPDSRYGQAMADPRYIENLRLMDARQHTLYDEAFGAYMDNRNADVHRVYATAAHDYPMSPLIPKFMFLEALSYVTENRPDEFRRVLTELLERYPDTDLTPYASSYIKGLDAGRHLNRGAANMRGMLWDIKLGSDSIDGGDVGELEFELNANDPQLLILLYPTDEVSPNELLYQVARHNFTSFVVKDFDLEQMNFGRLGLLIIKPFGSVSELNHYRSILNSNRNLTLPPQVRPVVISQKNFDTLMHSGASFDDYFRYMADKTYRDTEERVLPPDVYGDSYGIVTDDGPTASDSPDAPADPSEAAEPVSPGQADEPSDPAMPVEPAAPGLPIGPEIPAADDSSIIATPPPPAAAPPHPAPRPSYPVGSEGDDPLLE